MASFKTKNIVKKTVSFFSKGIVISLLLSLVPFVIIILLNPIDFQKYKISYEKKVPRSYENINWYEDLDGDGKEEYMDIYNHKGASMALLIYDSEGKHHGQYNLKYFMPKTTVFLEPFFIDLNKDNVKEILLFSQNKDSVYMSIFDYEKLEFILTDRFIAKIGLSANSKLDYRIIWIDARDVNNDRVKEIYFAIKTGFGLYPRNIYRYDFANDVLISSPNVGAQVATFQFSKSTLFVGSHASDNCGENYSYPYTDACSWIFGFNDKLEYKFKPIHFIGYPSSIASIVETQEGIAAIYQNQGSIGDTTQFVYINHKGKITNRKQIISSIIKPLIINRKIQYVLQNRINNKIYYFNIEKGIIGKEIKTLYNCGYKSSKDIDSDGEIEHFFYTNNFQQLIIARNNLQNNVAIDLNLRKENFRTVTSGFKKDYVELIVHTDFYMFYFKYFINPNYKFKYPFWFVVYLLSFLFISAILYIQKKLIQKRVGLEKRIIQLQLQNAQNQLDPHFTFNALNSVANHIFKEDKYKAYDLFERFSRLMRSSLAFSDKIFRSLEDEIQFTEDYLEFQKSRFKERFEYQISVADNINKTEVQIPKMIIQGFAENAVKHAFVGIDYIGFLQIKIEAKNNQIQIKVEDNGIGINASKKENPVPKSGYGMHILEEQIALINKLYEQKIEFEITDKSLQGDNLSGTKVVLVINAVGSLQFSVNSPP